MNNDEQKKKIVEIIRNMDSNSDTLDAITLGDIKQIADALIAAGIGDVKEAERRAKVAERALRDRATYCAMEDLDYFSLTTVAVEARAKELYDGWMQQAEKDLA